MKAQAYSLIAVMVSVPLMAFLVFYMGSWQNMEYGSSYHKIIADQVAGIGKGVERDFRNALSIAGKRAMLAATDKVILEGLYLDDAVSSIKELLVNGTLDGNESFVMENNTIEYWLFKIEQSVQEMNINLSYSNLSVYDSSSGIIIEVDLIVNISDTMNIAEISKTERERVNVSVEYIEDPLFPLNTGGYVGRSIVFYPYSYHAIKVLSGTVTGNCSGNVSFDRNDPDPSQKILVTNSSSGVSGFLGVISEDNGTPSVSCYMLGVPDAVQKINRTIQAGFAEIYLDNQSGGAWSLPVKEAIDNGYYSVFPVSGPGILGRLEGNLSERTYGMESFVNIPELQSRDIAVKQDQVSIDYIYFSGQTYTGSPVRGLPSWFRIDAANAAKYNLTELVG